MLFEREASDFIALRLPLHKGAPSGPISPCAGAKFGWCVTSSSVILGLEPLLSGLNLVDKAHGVDSTRIRMFGDNPGHERGATPCGMRIASFMIC